MQPLAWSSALPIAAVHSEHFLGQDLSCSHCGLCSWPPRMLLVPAQRSPAAHKQWPHLSPDSVHVSATIHSTCLPHTARSTCRTMSPESPATGLQFLATLPSALLQSV
jgi:hypothetical protein